MCLLKHSTENCLEEAKEDIVCYKLLLYFKGKYISPYQRFNYTEYVNNPEKIFEEKKRENIIVFGNNATIVDKGFIHFYSDPLSRIKYQMIKFSEEMDCREFKCIIPKGTTVIYGDDGTICAKKFRFIEETKI